ncbi:unnamed protein product [Heligmosomoides polygyrus]|uniref:PH domain-containing protein n=1 Tax=Heligmosomoides polygyrus TaxID=6339 RepID=A0A183F8E7_HELPZ|nr:unnamed protein product [Heligmosomoides polygyrus]
MVWPSKLRAVADVHNFVTDNSRCSIQDRKNGESVVVSIPRLWFREFEEDHRLPDVPILFCYEGTNFLRLLPLRIYQSDLISKGDFLEYKHQHQFNANLSLRGVALILDKNWNNAYLIPPSHKVGDRHYSLCTHFELSEQGHVLLSMRPTNSRRDTKEWISSVSPTIGNVRSRK